MVLITFIHQAIVQAISMLFGATGEIMTEKSGNLNLGIPGIMYMGGIAGLMGAFFYEKGNDNPSVLTGVLISLLCCTLASAAGGLIYTLPASAISSAARFRRSQAVSARFPSKQRRRVFRQSLPFFRRFRCWDRSCFRTVS